jgi:UDP-N-acetylmuramoyl-L-alanyl-D-glutamate--2,6-diaminopimelate ligase
VVMEMSSHALEQERVWGIPVDVAIFTNLTQDHLDYHGTMGRYASAKLRLFKGLGSSAPRVSFINADDPMADYFAGPMNHSLIKRRYGLKQVRQDFSAEDVRMSAAGSDFVWKTPAGSIEMGSPLLGLVNIYNLLAAAGGALERHVSLEEIAQGVPKLRQVPGRFEVVPGSAEAGFTVVVDYAHTDDALRNLIVLGRELVGAHGGRVITLFGCGGDRDRTKRPKMGRAAAECSDLVVLTSDNPRSEEPMAIIEEALASVRETKTECVVEADRAAAIELAIRAARAGDIVLLAGKGHEKVQILRSGTVPFDDVKVAESVLRKLS